MIGRLVVTKYHREAKVYTLLAFQGVAAASALMASGPA